MSGHDWVAPGSDRPEPHAPWPGTGPARPAAPPAGSQPVLPHRDLRSTRRRAEPTAAGRDGIPTAAGGTAYAPYPAPPGYAPAGGPGRPPRLRPAGRAAPGIIALRPLGLGDLYGATMKAIRGNVAATVGLAFVTTLVLTVPATLLGVWLASIGDSGSLGTATLAPLATYLPTLTAALASVILTGFLAYVVGQAVMGRRVSAGETWDGTRGRLVRVVGAALLTGVVQVLSVGILVIGPIILLVVNDGRSSSTTATGVVLLIVTILAAIAAGLFLWTRFGFATAAIVLERLGVVDGIRRSWALTSGTPFWRVLGVRLLTAIIVGFAGNVLTFPITMLGTLAALGTGNENAIFVWQTVIAGLTGVITGAITTPFTAGVDSLLYIDQRIRREALDVALIQAAQSAGRVPWARAGAR